MLVAAGLPAFEARERRQQGGGTREMAAKIEKIADGLIAADGPVWAKPGFLLFTDVAQERIYQWRAGRLAVRRNSSNFANGLAFDTAGRLLIGEHGRLVREQSGSTVKILADSYDGKGLNWINDLAVHRDSIYFTDLRPRWEQKAPPNPAKVSSSGVYRWNAGRGVSLISRACQEPNGIALGPTATGLYVADTAGEKIWRFDISSQEEIPSPQVFIDLKRQLLGQPDGIKCDRRGNLWIAVSRAICIFAPNGTLTGKIPFDADPTNCTFGEDESILFVTSATAVYKVTLSA
jgi:gluconolactonase